MLHALGSQGTLSKTVAAELIALLGGGRQAITAALVAAGARL